MDKSDPISVEQIFKDYKGRRAAIIKALTTDYDEFHRRCDPAGDNLCLFGYPDERWEVKLPTDDVPTRLPEPIMGINYIRDLYEQKKWLLFIADCSDVWLLSLAFCFGSRNVFDKVKRKRLFEMINELPVISEVLLEAWAEAESTEEQSTASTSESKHKALDEAESPEEQSTANTSKSKSKNKSRPQREYVSDGSGKEDEVEHCAACGKNGSEPGVSWIFCDLCQRWYHMECVDMDAVQAELIDEYECPTCA